MITQTLVFEFETEAQRRAVLDQFEAMLFADEAPRIVGLSIDDELHRASLISEALERYDDHYDFREAVDAVLNASNLKDWTWDKYEAEAVDAA